MGLVAGHLTTEASGLFRAGAGVAEYGKGKGGGVVYCSAKGEGAGLGILALDAVVVGGLGFQGLEQDAVQGRGCGLIDVVAEFCSRAVIHSRWAGGICFPQHDQFFGTIELQVRALDDFHLIAPFLTLCVVLSTFQYEPAQNISISHPVKVKNLHPEITSPRTGV